MTPEACLGVFVTFGYKVYKKFLQKGPEDLYFVAPELSFVEETQVEVGEEGGREPLQRSQVYYKPGYRS